MIREPRSNVGFIGAGLRLRQDLPSPSQEPAAMKMPRPEPDKLPLKPAELAELAS